MVYFPYIVIDKNSGVMDEIEMDLWRRLILVHHSSCWAKAKRNVVLYD
jgi:hypothetical protein